MDLGPRILLIPLGRPETLFGLGPIHATLDRAEIPMATGPWLAGPGGRPSAAGLGVLVDDAFGQAILSPRGLDGWSVTTELSLDIAAPLPTDGREVLATGEPVMLDDGGGLARGRVTAADGRVLAIGTTWHRYVPGVPASVLEPAPPPPVAPRGADLADLLAVEPCAELVLPVRPDLANPSEVVHGGILATLVMMLGEREWAGSDLALAAVNVRYLRPAVGVVTFRTVVEHAGRSLALVRVEARTATGKLCAAGTVTGRTSVAATPAR
ncbi:acyl-CoA thioesterase domain-containing protein [Pseudonocardia sp. RS010]|uniref:acyl-CoA thioesterase domain-containing protein n=1 Tax=Pseudonocardia sp. RS010 TaxID=3385979 RepID=UPI00399F0C41